MRPRPSTANDDLRPLSEIRILAFKRGPFAPRMIEGFYSDMATYRMMGYGYFIVVDDVDLHYWQETHQ